MDRVDEGTVLAGKYRIESLIGRGGMGSVWRAEHLGLRAPVAVKLLDMPGGMPTAESLQRFHREARAAANIRSPHVVQILDHGVDAATGAPFIVMELMEGESLADRLQRLGRLSPGDVSQIFTHIARALVRAHEAGIVHRDLKPDNVFLVRNEDEVVAKVLDFGIAKVHAHSVGGDSATRTGSVMGTAYYMSPEQISGAKDIDFRTDLWAFGVMACECLTGARPFEADTIGGLTLKICVAPIPVPSHLAQVPRGFDAWFAGIVSRDKASRFASARQAADALRAVLLEGSGAPSAVSSSLAATIAEAEHARVTSPTGAPFSVSSSLPAEPSFRGKRRGPWILGTLAVLAALGAAVWLSQSETSPVTASPPASAAPGVAVAAASAAEGSAGLARAPELAPPEASAAAAASLAPPPLASQKAAPPAPKARAAAPRLSATPKPRPLPQQAKQPSAPDTPAVRDVIDDRH